MLSGSSRPIFKRFQPIHISNSLRIGRHGRHLGDVKLHQLNETGRQRTIRFRFRLELDNNRPEYRI